VIFIRDENGVEQEYEIVEETDSQS